MQNTNELPQIPSSEPSVPPQHSSRGGIGTIAIILLVVALILVLGAGLLAGWEFGRNNSTSSTPGTTSQATTSQDAAVIATAQDFQPSVVQINVTTEKGSGLGSGTIIDSRG
jgi:putative serine protease PepD